MTRCSTPSCGLRRGRPCLPQSPARLLPGFWVTCAIPWGERASRSRIATRRQSFRPGVGSTSTTLARASYWPKEYGPAVYRPRRRVGEPRASSGSTPSLQPPPTASPSLRRSGERSIAPQPVPDRRRPPPAAYSSALAWSRPRSRWQPRRAELFRRSSGAARSGRAQDSVHVRRSRELAVDGAGSIYSADCQDAFAFRVDRQRVLSIVAGNGTLGFSGNEGPALKAELACPSGVALDGKGNLYVADHLNNRVRRVDPGGVIHAYAGTGQGGAFGGDSGPAALARFSTPTSLAFDRRGDLYVADRDNGAVRKITTAGLITTVAGTGSLGYSGDAGPAVKARLNQPQGLAFDRAGNLYISDSANNRVRRVDGNGVITTMAGNGHHGDSGEAAQRPRPGSPTPTASYSTPTATSTSHEPDEGVVRRIDTKGIITRVARHRETRILRRTTDRRSRPHSTLPSDSSSTQTGTSTSPTTATGASASLARRGVSRPSSTDTDDAASLA